MKLTPWFDWSESPPRPGVYEIGLDGEPCPFPYHYWSGTHWSGSGATPAECHRSRACTPELHQDFYMAEYDCEWRGLATKDGK
jgi:hypothetical protein